MTPHGEIPHGVTPHGEIPHYDLLSALARESDSYLEIGVQEGGSLSAVLRSGPSIRRLLLCDTWGDRHGGTSRGNHDHIDRLLSRLGYRGSVAFLDGRSQDTLPGIDCPPFALSLVDGGHDYEEARADIRNAWRLTAPGGRILIHDISFPKVWAAVWDAVRDLSGLADSSLYFEGQGSLVLTKGAT